MRAATFLLASAVLYSPTVAQPPDHARTFGEIASAEASQLPQLRIDLQAAYAQVPGGSELLEGLLTFREYELTGDAKRASDAASLLDRARGAGPDDPWLHYAYALAVAHGPDVQANGAILRTTGRSWAQMLGFDAHAKATRAAERALELDSLHAGAAGVYGELALQALESNQLQKARAALERVADSSASAATVLARLLAQMEEPALALRHAQRAVDLDPRDGEARLVLAIALLQLPDRAAEGAREYFTASELAAPTLAARMFEEVRPIATPGDVSRWRVAAVSERRKWFETFWDVRASLANVSVPDRLAEHYRRLRFALREYPRTMSGPVSQKALILQPDSAPVDQRGQLYIRHGAPWKRYVSDATRLVGEEIAPACDLLSHDPGGEAWRRLGTDQRDDHTRITFDKQYYSPGAELWAYETEEGIALHALVRCPRTSDFTMPYELPCNLLQWGPEVAQQSFDIERCGDETPERRRVVSREALRTDTHGPDIERRLPLQFDMLSFRGSGGLTDLLVPIAIGTDSLRGTSVPGGHQYAVRLLAAVVDTAAQRVERSDTTLQFIAPAELTASRLSLHALLSATPTDDAFFRLYVQNAEFEQDGGLAAQRVRIPSYRGDTLMISDVVLGSAVEGGNFSRGGRRITLMPFARFVDGRFRMFYEVYNVPRDTRYRTQLLVEHSTGRPQDGVRLEFQDEAEPDADGVIRVLRSMGTELQPGLYRLTLRIVLPDNRYVEKARVFLVGEGGSD